MAERKDSEEAGGEATPSSGPGAPQVNPEITSRPKSDKSELPAVESPPLSPGADAPEVTVDEPVVLRAVPKSIFESRPMRLRPRHKRLALLAASVAIAASLGAVIGAAAGGGLWSKPHTDPAAMQALQERKAMSESLAHLSRQVAALKADLDKANKATHSKIAKLTGRLEATSAPAPARTTAPETTGSVPPQKVVAADVPMPRPAPRVAAAESRPVVVPDWSIRAARGGFIYVESRGGIYQVVPGAYLPGLGPVQSIERKDGHWAVVTPSGIIVSMRDRRYFE